MRTNKHNDFLLKKFTEYLSFTIKGFNKEDLNFVIFGQHGTKEKGKEITKYKDIIILSFTDNDIGHEMHSKIPKIWNGPYSNPEVEYEISIW